MDMLEVKNRIAGVLVEAIFRRARCEVTRPTQEEVSFRVGREEPSPNLRVIREDEDGTRQEFLVAVKYRPAIEQYIAVESQRRDRSVLRRARQKWPELSVVLVSERPAAGRSCFQVLSLRDLEAGVPLGTVDLADRKEFGLFRHNVEDHEELLRQLFSFLKAG